MTVNDRSDNATLEPVKFLENFVVENASNSSQTPEKEELLLRLVEEHGGELSKDEKLQVLTLLMLYSDIFATS